MQSYGFRSPESPCILAAAEGDSCGQAQVRTFGHFVFEIDFMVKLLRACVWMPWRKEAMKDVVSCDKLREDANSL